jgi:flagellar biosynthesis protein FliR
MPELSEAVFVAFAIFCRVGAVMMFLPGIGSARVAMSIRLLIAVAMSLALTPLLFGAVSTMMWVTPERQRLYLIFNELAVGSAMGLMARFFLLALQFSATTTANTIGLAGVPGQPVDDTEALPPLTNLISVAGVMVLITAGLPEEMIRAVAGSYDTLPLRVGLDTEWLIGNLTKVAADTSLLALRLSAPFIAYAVVVNIAMGLANKFTPQISMYFTSLGVVTLGGLVLLYFTVRQMLHVFAESFGSWILAN